MQKQKYRDLRKHYSRPRKNTIQKPASLYAKHVRLSYDFQIDQIYGFLDFYSISHPNPSIYMKNEEVRQKTKIPLKFGLFTKMPRGSQIEFCDFWPMTKIPSKFGLFTKMPLTWGTSRQGVK